MNAVFRTRLLACLLLFASAPAWSQSPDKAFVGHYYLRGIMETGSELLLKPDGRYEWMLAYGAMDQASQGRWARVGNQIVLTADAAPERKELVAFKGARAWDVEAERARLERLRDVEEARINERCAFLYSNEAQSPPPFEDPPPHKTDAELKAEDARIRQLDIQHAKALADARQADAAAVAVAHTPRRDAEFARARSARTAFVALDNALRRAYVEYNDQRIDRESRFAARDVLDIPNLQRPQQCVPPESVRLDENPAKWKPMPAIYVSDTSSGESLRRIPLSLVFDKRMLSFQSGDDGWAIPNLPAEIASQKPKAVIVDASVISPKLPEARFAIPANAGPVIEIAIDMDALVTPAFQTMQLRIDGADLIPHWPERGERERYHRD